MKKKLNYLAIVPARSGSQRIKNKNIFKVNGDPLLGIAIRNAIQTKVFSKVILSTDSEDYYKLGLKYGADASGIRPKRISLSTSSDYEHIKYQINFLKKKGFFFDAFVILRPTNPFRTQKTIFNAIEKFERFSNKIDSLRAVKPVSEHPYKMWIKDKKNNQIFPFVNLKNKRGISYHSMQKTKLPKVFIQSAMIEISWIRNLDFNSISGDKVIPFEASLLENFDINDPIDLEYLKIILKKNKA